MNGGVFFVHRMRSLWNFLVKKIWREDRTQLPPKEYIRKFESEDDISEL